MWFAGGGQLNLACAVAKPQQGGTLPQVPPVSPRRINPFTALCSWGRGGSHTMAKTLMAPQVLARSDHRGGGLRATIQNLHAPQPCSKTLLLPQNSPEGHGWWRWWGTDCPQEPFLGCCAAASSCLGQKESVTPGGCSPVPLDPGWAAGRGSRGLCHPCSLWKPCGCSPCFALRRLRWAPFVWGWGDNSRFEMQSGFQMSSASPAVG